MNLGPAANKSNPAVIVMPLLKQCYTVQSTIFTKQMALKFCSILVIDLRYAPQSILVEVKPRLRGSGVHVNQTVAIRILPPQGTLSRRTRGIRVVKAFQAGLDRREPSLTGQSAARLREISRQLRLQVENEGRGEFAIELLLHKRLRGEDMFLFHFTNR
ncbi:unnamed protein product [Nippostrongylus brasiliensis]|uniref:RF_PROK_I domain-containing protein n=1 Tax=Nippostrongylus brasiliensis TaxID=27835 RepID=A0A0N4YQM4_NIPBR|nr:unnamed protein product [Nippostrongylus brasiliensis]